ncbi:MAG: type II toxin-antitoxin system YafQ family toxin [Lachnospiraceae bacterium]|nr:type II toxin-antitoxin system YafQ family toxin [Lachnospiraceae bacterium]
MLDIRYSTRFKKDMKLCNKRNYNMNLIQEIIDTLRIPASLPDKNRDHTLIGQYAGYKECHILPDWLLIYRINGNELLLYRTGTHAELFGK